MNWTEEKKTLVRQGYDARDPAHVIALKVGCSAAAVRGAADRMQLKSMARSRRTWKLSYCAGPAFKECQFPRGDSPDWDFCGANTKPDSPYCPEHRKVCYRGKDYEPGKFVGFNYR